MDSLVTASTYTPKRLPFSSGCKLAINLRFVVCDGIQQWVNQKQTRLYKNFPKPKNQNRLNKLKHKKMTIATHNEWQGMN